MGYPKTSGGRGVHVFLRIKTDWDFIAVRRAGIALAREVERRAPDAVTTSWWKEERGKRIFIDFNQNARDRTFASAYSVRRTADRDGVDAADLGRAGRRRSRRLHDRDGGRVWSPTATTRGPTSTRVGQSIEPLLEMVAADEERGLGDLPYPPNYPKMPGEPKRVQPSKDTDRTRKTTDKAQ